MDIVNVSQMVSHQKQDRVDLNAHVLVSEIRLGTHRVIPYKDVIASNAKYMDAIKSEAVEDLYQWVYGGIVENLKELEKRLRTRPGTRS